MGLAVFDIDGTLVGGRATERRFAGHLLRRGHVGLRQGLAFARFMPAAWREHGRHALKKNKAWLDGLAEADLEALAAAWVEASLESAWIAPCVARVARHRAAGDGLVLMSGTPHFIASAVGARLGIRRVVATRCATRDGYFTAAAPLRHPFGESKRVLLAGLCDELGEPLSAVTAYADSADDLPLLRTVGHAVAVCPDARLAVEARRRGWEIIGDAGLRRRAERTLVAAVQRIAGQVLRH